MKTAFLKLAAFALCATVFISSCKEEPKEEPKTPSNFKPTVMDVNFPGLEERYIIEYDDQLRVKKFTTKYANSNGDSSIVFFECIYENNRFIEKFHNENGDVRTTTYTLSAMGRVDEIVDIYDSLVYNTNGYLTEAHFDDSSKFVLSYTNGNLMAETYYENSVALGAYEYQYYTDKEDKYRLSTLFLEDDAPQYLRLFNPVFGIASKNLIKQISDPEEGVYTISYEYDANGFPTKVIGKQGLSSGVICTVSFR